MNSSALLHTRFSALVSTKSPTSSAPFPNSKTWGAFVVKIPEPIRSLPAILLSLLIGGIVMSAFFGIFLPMLFSIPAARSQLGAPVATVVSNFAPVTNAVSTAAGIVRFPQQTTLQHPIASEAAKFW